MAQNRQQLEIDLRLNVDNLKKSTKEARGDFDSYISALKTALSNLPDGRTAIGKSFAEQKRQIRSLIKELQELKKAQNLTQGQSQGAQAKVQTVASNLGQTTNRALFEQNKRDIDAMSTAQKQAYIQTIQDDSRYRKELAYTQQTIREEYKKTQQAIKEQEAVKKQEQTEQNKILKQTEEMVNRSITLRYALYDVASTLQSASRAMISYGKATFGAAIQQESVFSRIEKTQIGAPIAQLEELKKELIDLSTEIPRTFDELTSIGMLGAQLGIATEDIAKFTEVVAKFSTITGVTVEETALAFGKLASLLEVPAGKFDQLGASIARVGVNGASTEQQILSTAKQIGAVANAAGFSAGEVVGLASAMASLGIAPEEARGVLIPTFQEIDRAVRSFNQTTKQGSESLKIFSEVAGVSAEDFVKQWSDKESGGAYDAFEQFIVGLGNTDISKSLERLRLDGNRTSKGLTALGSSAEKMGMQVREAVDGFGEGTFLDESFATTLEDIASKLKMTQSAFEALLASFAGNEAALSIFGIALDLVKMLANALRDLVEGSRVGSFFVTLVSGLVMVGGFILQLVSALAIAAAGFLAVKVAAVTAVNNPATDSGLVRMIAGLVGVRNASTGAAAGLTSVGTAGTIAGGGLRAAGLGAMFAAGGVRALLASTGVGAVLVLLGIALEKTINLLFPIENAAEDAAGGLDEFGDSADGAKKDTSTLRSELDAMLSKFNEVALAPYKVEEALYDMGAAFAENGKGFSQFSEGGRANMDALAGVVEALKNQANGDAEETYNAVWGFMIALEQQGYMTAEAYTYLNGVMQESAGLAGGIGSLMPKTFNLESFFKGVKSGANEAGGAVKTLGDIIDEVFKKLDNRIDVSSSLDSLKQSLIDNGNSFSVFSESGRKNIGALRDTIDSLAEASNGNRTKFSSDLNALKKAMVDAGLRGTRAMDMINKALKASGKNAKASKTQIREFAAALRTLDAQRVVGVANAIDRLSNSVMDYLNARWMLGNAQMDIAAGWEEIANASRDSNADMEDARDTIEDISDELAGFAADRGILEYQLAIAIKYGDTLRANEIRAELARLADEEKKLIEDNQRQREEADRAERERQQERSQNAQSNYREEQLALQQMVGYYVQMGAAEVISAKNKKDAKAAINETVQAFKEQAREAGVSEENVKKYAKELRAGLKLAKELNKPAEYKINSRTQAALNDIRNFRDQANAAINAIRTNVTVTVTTVQARSMGGPIFAASGGYITGGGGPTSDSIPAMLSNGEYVVRAAAVNKYGLDFMSAVNGMKLQSLSTSGGQSSGIMGEQIVYLSPEDRNLLREAIDRPINLYTDNTRIAQSANAGNVTLAQRGMK